MGRATNFLILVCIVASIYSWYTGADLSFGLDTLLAGRYYTLITAIFVHASITHLAGNMIFLHMFGSFVERHFGRKNLMLAFFVGGILSFLLSIPFYPGSRMVGASAAIFTLAALAMLARPLSFTMFLVPLGVIALAFFLYNILAIAEGVGGNTGFVGHVAGFITGIGIGALWVRDWKENLVVTIIALIIYVVLINAILYYLAGYIIL